MKFRRIFDSRGFVLLETLLIVVLLSTAAVMVLRGYRSAYELSRETAIRTTAMYLANAQLAELQYAAANNQPLIGKTSRETVEHILGGGDDKGLTVTFEIRTSVTGSNGVHHATVTVTPMGEGSARSYPAVTLERALFNRNTLETESAP